jgi:toxin YoeB
MIYKVAFTIKADEDIKILKRSEPQAYKKLLTFLTELQEHPTTSTGHPEPLSME